MRIAQVEAGVIEWATRLRGEPQRSSKLQSRHPGVVGHRVPLMQLGVRIDDGLVLQQPVAEAVDYSGDGEDSAETLVKSRLAHDSAPSLNHRPGPPLAGQCSQRYVPHTSGTLVALRLVRRSVSCKAFGGLDQERVQRAA